MQLINKSSKQIHVADMKSRKMCVSGSRLVLDLLVIGYTYLFFFSFHNSVRWKILLGFLCRNRLLLTGTPIQNSMAEVCRSSSMGCIFLIKIFKLDRIVSFGALSQLMT